MDSNKVLYVDDEYPNRVMFKITFRNLFEMQIASSGGEALEILKTDPEISIVISDMLMPGMNGLEFINHARAFNPKLRFALLTGLEVNDEIQEAMDNQIIENYFKKPFDKYKILEYLGIEINKPA